MAEDFVEHVVPRFAIDTPGRARGQTAIWGTVERLGLGQKEDRFALPAACRVNVRRAEQS